ncbi:MAG: AAA family ATPase, partial [Bernardetiaceae bacterium]|nr:AAA family ATPase [Bernardetiaceae bacterium]
MPLPLLPTGQQDFAELRRTQRLYVDKTFYVWQLLQQGSIFFFLSRPRRFGKSLLISLLKCLFEGKQDLFKGLFIYDKIHWQTYPVIHLDFSHMDFTDLGLYQAIHQRLDEIAQSYQIALHKKGIGLKFAELMERMHQQMGNQVVILIDEYDKPITDALETQHLSQAYLHRDILRQLYSVVKGSSQHIKFFFMTGITRFSKVSLFSDLNNLTDLTYFSAFHDLL